MKNIKILIGVAFLFLSLPTMASEPSKEQLIQLAKSTGMYEQIEEQKLAMKQQAIQAAQQYTQQVTSSVPELPSEFRKDLEEEFEAYMANVATILDTDYAVNEYMALISKKLSSDDVDKIIDFYSTDVGKKYIAGNIAIMGEWTIAVVTDYEQKLMVHLKTFGQNLMTKAENHSNK